MASCSGCKKALTKQDETKRVEARTQPDGSTQFFGIATGLKKLSEAKGKIKAVYHYRCYFVMAKHDRMGPNGRYLEDSPTAYEESQRYTNRDDASEEARLRRESAEAEYTALRHRLVDVTSEPGGGEADQQVLDLEEELAAAEQAVALAKRQEEIAAERSKEETPSAFNDWRDPLTLDIGDVSSRADQ